MRETDGFDGSSAVENDAHGCEHLIMMLFGASGLSQEHDPGAVIRLVNAAVAARFENIVGFTDVEHYAVYRGGDETHPVAEMTVKDTYKKGVGKTYNIHSESGSSIFLHFGLKPLLDNEQTINQPGNVEKSWFNSANYAMKLNEGMCKGSMGATALCSTQA